VTNRNSDNVLIAGGGPVGLICALVLQKYGIPGIIFESGMSTGTELRGSSFHAPTLDMLDEIGITERMLEVGIKATTFQYYDREEGLLAEFDFGLLKDLTAYPFRLHLGQDQLCCIAYEKLMEGSGWEVRFGHHASTVITTEDDVRLTTETENGPQEFAGRYLIGADGAASAVRKSLAIEFEGFTWPEQYLMAQTTHRLQDHGYSNAAYIADPVEWKALFHLPQAEGAPIWRVVLPADPQTDDAVLLSEQELQRRLQNFIAKDSPYEITHRQIYKVHQRVATTFRAGNTLLAGDSAHVVNPMGALGLNGGIHDVFNLGEKLDAIRRGETDKSILDRYVRQRREVNVNQIQASSIRNKKRLEEQDPLVRRKNNEELKRLAGDPDRAQQYVKNASLITSLEKAAEID
jgi:3-(3-hydroxy-phenyl)propionate hydroxylase